MTVMPSSSDVADKAVSTEDAKSGSGLELGRLEAVLAALVDGKLEAMKRAESGRAASEPVSPRPRPRLASSSSQPQPHRHRHHHHHHHQQHSHDSHDSHERHQRRHLHKQQRRHDSAPCSQQLERAFAESSVNEASCADCPASSLPQSACYGQFDEDEYLAFGYADELCGPDDDSLSGEARCYRQQRPERFHRPRRKRRKRRRRRARDRQSRGPSAHLVDIELADELELGVVIDPDDLPPRARWTIVATACLLLAMSLMLVGVTLRMAPIIDEMGCSSPEQSHSLRKENEELLNSLNRDMTNNSMTAPSLAA